MHPAAVFRTTDRAALVARAREHPFALLVGADGSAARTTHTPVLLEDDGTLRFHVARANALAPSLAETRRALAVFTGPHAYISPRWYELPDQVGTWNYVSVEAEGHLTPLEAGETLAFLHDLAATFDGPDPWTAADIDPSKLARLQAAIVAYRMTPERFEGITKLSQNKPAEARARVAARLGAHPVAALMREV